MKFSSLAISLGLVASSTHAFTVVPVSKQPSTVLKAFNGPQNGGVDGSSVLPGQYGKVLVNEPFGSQARSIAQTPGGANKPTNYYTEDSQVAGIAKRSPVNGGINGSTNLPGPYNRVNAVAPYGGSYEYQQSRSTNTMMMPGAGSVEAYQTGPINGGVNGSSKVPQQYDTVNRSNPYGGRPNEFPAAGNASNIFSGEFPKGIRGGPINGGLNGSSLLPTTYETVNREHPWGDKNTQATADYYNPQSSSMVLASSGGGQTSRGALLPATAPITNANRLRGSTGGVDGSSMIIDRGLVSIDNPYGNAR